MGPRPEPRISNLEADPENLHRGANQTWGTFTRYAAVTKGGKKRVYSIYIGHLPTTGGGGGYGPSAPPPVDLPLKVFAS